MKICLLGTQGTGKTTLVNMFRDKYKTIDGVARTVLKCQPKNKLDQQKQIFKDYLTALEQDNYLSTRSVIDVLAYTLGFCSNNEDVDWKIELEYEYRQVQAWIKKNPDIVVCYIPIEFDIEDDGVRSIDKEYQYTIDTHMKDMFDKLDIKYKYIIKGNLEQRVEQLKAIIEAHTK